MSEENVCRFSPDMKWLAAGHQDGIVNIHALATTELRRDNYCKVPAQAAVHHMDFSAQSDFIKVCRK
jgi:hypothetical protein